MYRPIRRTSSGTGAGEHPRSGGPGNSHEVRLERWRLEPEALIAAVALCALVLLALFSVGFNIFAH